MLWNSNPFERDKHKLWEGRRHVVLNTLFIERDRINVIPPSRSGVFSFVRLTTTAVSEITVASFLPQQIFLGCFWKQVLRCANSIHDSADFKDLLFGQSSPNRSNGSPFGVWASGTVFMVCTPSTVFQFPELLMAQAELGLYFFGGVTQFNGHRDEVLHAKHEGEVSYYNGNVRRSKIYILMEPSPEVAAYIANNRTVVKIIEYGWGFSSELVSVTLVYQVTMAGDFCR